MSARSDLAFLPAALEIEQTPPLPPARAIGWSIMGFFTIAVLWSYVGQVNIVGSAPGKVVPSSRVRQVQPFVAGVVRTLAVREGQTVAAGDLLVALDDTQSRSDLQRLNAQRQHLMHERLRLAGLIAGLGGGDVTTPAGAELPAGIRAQMEQAFSAFSATRMALQEELLSNRAERAAVSAQMTQIARTLPLLSERVEAVRVLERRALAPRSAWLELEELRMAKVTERAIIAAQYAVLDTQHAHIERRLTELQARTEAQWRGEFIDIERAIDQHDYDIVKAEAMVAQHVIAAPVSGSVQQLAVNTVGGVVTSAQNLMSIVPNEGGLRIEAWVANKDIGFVRAGQATVVKIETFPFTKYGTLSGTVETVSDDAVVNEGSGLVYLIQVRLDKRALARPHERLALTPGMAVTVEIDMGKRRVIDYLLAPLLRYQDEGLRER